MILGAWAIGGSMWGGQEEAQSIAAIAASIDAGVNIIDTAPVYGMGRSEEMVGKAIRGRRDKVLIATKCGLIWDRAEGTLRFNMIDVDGGQHPVHHDMSPGGRARGAARTACAGCRPTASTCCRSTGRIRRGGRTSCSGRC